MTYCTFHEQDDNNYKKGRSKRIDRDWLSDKIKNCDNTVNVNDLGRKRRR